jgi:hypothetical protein
MPRGCGVGLQDDPAARCRLSAVRAQEAVRPSPPRPQVTSRYMDDARLIQADLRWMDQAMFGATYWTCRLHTLAPGHDGKL